ncbi:MAG: YkgJ family cysteine cluster protein [Draconibacterium sp.]
MKSKLTDPIEKYREVRNTIDKHVSALEKKHNKHMVCRKGCDLCCMDYSIFPVEFYSVLKELKNRNFVPEKSEAETENGCVFLVNHACTIYAERPVICRTHGLPLIFANDDGEFELSVCELNFTNFDFEDFDMDNTFHQDKYNSMLFMVNREFINASEDKKFGELDLIPLKELATHFIK